MNTNKKTLVKTDTVKWSIVERFELYGTRDNDGTKYKMLN